MQSTLFLIIKDDATLLAFLIQNILESGKKRLERTHKTIFCKTPEESK